MDGLKVVSYFKTIGAGSTSKQEVRSSCSPLIRAHLQRAELEAFDLGVLLT